MDTDAEKQAKAERVRAGLLRVDRELLVDWLMSIGNEITELQRRVSALENADADNMLLRTEVAGHA